MTTAAAAPTSPTPPALSAPASTQSPGRPRLHHWTFSQLINAQDEHGRLNGQRVELIDGKVYDMAPQYNLHMIAVSKIMFLLKDHFPEHYFVGNQATHRFDEDSAPEPDINILPKTPPAEGYARPDLPVLLIEVSQSTLAHDRSKASLYAFQGVREYWIVNLKDRQVEVYRNPSTDREAEYGGRYQAYEIVDESGSVAPTIHPDPPLRVADMLT